MARRLEESDLLINPVSQREAQTSLLSPIPELQGARYVLHQISCLPCNICVKSKAALLILLWSVVIGAFYLSLLTGFVSIGFVLQNNYFKKELNWVVFVFIVEYAILALIQLLYPLSGFIADVYWGRYKTVTVGVVLLWISMLFVCGVVVIGIKVKFGRFGYLAIPCVLFAAIALILIIVGLACYQANIIQLGLDQLLEAPSEKLGLFVHWLMWAYTLGSFTILVLFFTFLPCYVNNKTTITKLSHGLASTPFVFLFIITVLLIFTCYNHGWFYSEPGQNNPYKTLVKVLDFARKHKYPLCPSAFTFSDDFRPSRIDFAKERFGGPFSTEQVEDVKTLLKIVIVLLALGPLFILEIPRSNVLFLLFSLHTGETFLRGKDEPCTSPAKWVIVQSGGLGYVISILLSPLYMWVIYSLLRKRVPNILNRLLFAVVTSLAGVVCLLTVDLVGHFHYQQQHQFTNSSTNGTCLFISSFPYKKHIVTNVLNMHWSVSLPPAVLLNVGSLLVRATSFEFISAQSPHSMKGLLVGVFFSIRGIFQFIGAAVIIPFAIPNIWNQVSSVTNCGFGYYLVTIVVASIGLVVLSIVVKKYRYRQRDERPFDARFAEEYYERYIGNTQNLPALSYSPSDDLKCHSNLGQTLTGSSSNAVSLSVRRDYGATKEYIVKDTANRSRKVEVLPDKINSMDTKRSGKMKDKLPDKISSRVTNRLVKVEDKFPDKISSRE